MLTNVLESDSERPSPSYVSYDWHFVYLFGCVSESVLLSWRGKEHSLVTSTIIRGRFNLFSACFYLLYYCLRTRACIFTVLSLPVAAQLTEPVCEI